MVSEHLGRQINKYIDLVDNKVRAGSPIKVAMEEASKEFTTEEFEQMAEYMIKRISKKQGAKYGNRKSNG